MSSHMYGGDCVACEHYQIYNIQFGIWKQNGVNKVMKIISAPEQTIELNMIFEHRQRLPWC